MASSASIGCSSSVCQTDDQDRLEEMAVAAALAARFTSASFIDAQRAMATFKKREAKPARGVIGLDGVMTEVKRRQSMNIHKVMKESQAHCTEAMLPMILHRKDGEEWLLTIRLEDLPKALEKLNPS